MSKQIALRTEPEQDYSIIEQVVIQGDLSKLSGDQRVTYYRTVCNSLGLNPYTRPFEYIMLSGKLTLYAKKDATEQLRKINGISIDRVEGKLIDDLYVVTARAKTQDGRTDEATGVVNIGNLKGEQRANALMKAETKAKRRVTLSISGMGWCDETEIETIPGAQPVAVDFESGAIKAIEHKPETITQGQYQQMIDALSECDEDYRTRVMKYLNSKGFSDLAISVSLYNESYEKILNKIAEEREAKNESVDD